MIFDFTNKAYGSVLDITVGGWNEAWGKTAGTKVGEWTSKGDYVVSDLKHIGGEVAGWEFTPVLTNMFGKNVTVATATYYSLNSYINQTQVATLVYNDNTIQIAVVNADKLKDVPNQIKFILKEADEINEQVHNPERGFHAEFKENEGWDIRLGKVKLNSWYGTLIILGIVLAVFILFSELTH